MNSSASALGVLKQTLSDSPRSECLSRRGSEIPEARRQRAKKLEQTVMALAALLRKTLAARVCGLRAGSFTRGWGGQSDRMSVATRRSAGEPTSWRLTCGKA